MKNKLTLLALISTITFSTMIKAEDITIPTITKPAILEEGTQRELSQAQIAELLPWAKDTKMFLTDLLDNTQGLATLDKIDRITSGIKQVVADSGPKNSELFMRYVLNRSLVLIEVLDKEMNADAVGSADAKARILNLSINMALKYYDADVAKLKNSKTVSPYAAFGIEYYTFLKELNKSIFDASAQYNIERISLEWLQWDLYRDLNNTSYAPQIVKINNALKTFPVSKLSDAQSISYIRQIRKVSEQLNITEKKQLPQNNNNGLNQAEDLTEIVTGARFIDNNGFIGTVKAVFANGTVSAVFDGYGALETRNISNLSLSVKCLNQFCVSDKIIDNNGFAGTILMIFKNGKASATFDGYGAKEGRALSNLAKETRCYGNICVNDRIIDNNGFIGTVKRVFEDGQVKAVFDGYGALETRKTSNLSKQL